MQILAMVFAYHPKARYHKLQSDLSHQLHEKWKEDKEQLKLVVVICIYFLQNNIK